MQSPRGSSTEGMTPVLAAKWTIASAPSAARSARSPSVMSPTTSSTRSSEEKGPGSPDEIACGGQVLSCPHSKVVDDPDGVPVFLHKGPDQGRPDKAAAARDQPVHE